MKGQSGKSPLGWIITIVVVAIIIGVSIAMLFGNGEEVSNLLKQNQNTNTNNTVQTETK